MVANLLALHLLVTSILFFAAGTYSLNRRDFNAAGPFGMVMFLCSGFMLLAGADVFSTNLEQKILLVNLRVSMLPFLSAGVLVTAIENARRSAWLAGGRIFLLYVVPIVNLFFVWAPGLNPFFMTDYRLTPSSLVGFTLSGNHGPWAWILLTYSTALAILTFGIQFYTLLNSKGIYFKQTLFLALGQVFPAVAILLAGFGRLPYLEVYNYAPHLFMITALLNGWAIYRYQWLYASPVVRDIVIDHMSDMLLVVDQNGCLSDANPVARKELDILDTNIGKNLTQILPDWEQIQKEAAQARTLRTEIKIATAGHPSLRVYELVVNTIRAAKNGKISAYVLLMREITEQKYQQEQIQNLARAVDQSPNSVLITDTDGVIEYVNPSFTRLTGYSAEEAIGQKTSLFKSGQTPASVYIDMWETIKAGKIWKGDLLNRRKDGEIYWEETFIAPLFDQYGNIVNYISIKEDISARKEIDEILHRRLEELLMVNTISLAAASQLELPGLVELVGKQLEQFFNVRSVLVAIHNQEAGTIELPYWTIDRKRVETPTLKYGEGLVSHVLKTREPLLIATNFKETAPELGHKPIYAHLYGSPKTWLGVPIMAGAEAVGVISLQNYQKEFAFQDDDVRLLTTIAASIGIAIKNANLFKKAQQEIEDRIRAEKEARQRADQMSVLYQIGHDITSGLDLEVVLNSLMEKCKQIAPVDVFAVGLYEPENQLVRFIKFNDQGRELKTNLSIDLEENLTSEVIQKRRLIYISDTNQEAARQKHHIMHTTEHHARTYLGIPLSHGNQVTGILSVQSYQPNAFSPEQIQTLEIIAAQAAIAIENARLYEVTRRRADEMSLLYEVSLELSENLDTDQVLRNLLHKCRQILPMDSFYVSVYEESTHLIYYPLFYDRGEFKNVPVRDMRVSPGLTGEVIMSARTLYLPDTTKPKTAQQYQIIHIGGTPSRSFVGVPMTVRGRVIGVISMQAYEPNKYSQEQIRLLETIATQAAIALENSRLYENARREINERRRAQEDLQQTNQELQVQLSRVESLQEELREQAIRDALTGLYNRRYLDEVFSRKVNRMGRKGSSLAVMMLDIDHFKKFNDTHGHKAGDQLLSILGKLLLKHTRQSDVACRYGGEEFVILLADTSLDVAAKRAEEIRQAFEQVKIDCDGKQLGATISIGISVFPEHGNSPEGLLIQADQALYAAKAGGRNQVVAWKR